MINFMTMSHRYRIYFWAAVVPPHTICSTGKSQATMLFPHQSNQKFVLSWEVWLIQWQFCWNYFGRSKTYMRWRIIGSGDDLLHAWWQNIAQNNVGSSIISSIGIKYGETLIKFHYSINKISLKIRSQKWPSYYSCIKTETNMLQTHVTWILAIDTISWLHKYLNAHRLWLARPGISLYGLKFCRYNTPWMKLHSPACETCFWRLSPHMQNFANYPVN